MGFQLPFPQLVSFAGFLVAINVVWTRFFRDGRVSTLKVLRMFLSRPWKHLETVSTMSGRIFSSVGLEFWDEGKVLYPFWIDGQRWYIYIYYTCNLFVLCFNPPKEGPFQSKQGSLGFQVCIYCWYGPSWKVNNMNDVCCKNIFVVLVDVWQLYIHLYLHIIFINTYAHIQRIYSMKLCTSHAVICECIRIVYVNASYMVGTW